METSCWRQPLSGSRDERDERARGAGFPGKRGSHQNFSWAETLTEVPVPMHS